MKDIYKVPPTDNMKVASMEPSIEKLLRKAATPGGKSMLEDVQALIERIKLDEQKIKKLEKMNGIKLDEQKIKKLEKMNGISWLGDEQKGEKMNLAVTAADLYKDRSIWDIPINVADGGIREQAFWQGRECGARELEERIFWKKHGN